MPLLTATIDVIYVCNVYQKFKKTRLLFLSSFIILLNVT